ncbi:MAG: hypothetical protein JXK93_02590 [Sphaerochaetaceae bacterium]|nr:hypothetical protein [Sphaerochaetaceae bacterium]
MNRKMHLGTGWKKVLIFLGILSIGLSPLLAITQSELDMFRTLEGRWRQSSDNLYKERDAIGADDPRYMELTKQIIKAEYKVNYYKEAQIDRSSMWVILKNTVMWSASDLAETASIMWDTSENLLEKMYTANWSDLLKDTADALMRQKVRAMIRETFSQENRAIEDHIIGTFISPKLEKSKTEEYAEAAFSKVKDGLKDAYVEEAKRQAVTKTAGELKAYGEKIAERVGGAVSAAEFTIDMVQKYVMWDDAQVTIRSMLSAIQTIQRREECSVVKAFNIYLGKEEMTKPEVPAADTVQVQPAVPASSPDTDMISEAETKPQETEEILWKEASEERFASRTPEQVIAEYIDPAWSLKHTYVGDIYYDLNGSPRYQVKRWSESSEFAGQVLYIQGINTPKHFYFYHEVNGKSCPAPGNMMIKEVHGENYGNYLSRSWYLNGQIKEYKEYKYFSCIEHITWDEDGTVTYHEKK